MGFQSILGKEKLKYIEPDNILMPLYFRDLNLDQIVDDIMEERNMYDLRKYYYFMAQDESMIQYRQEVLRDLEIPELYQSVVNFAIGIRKAKEYSDHVQRADYVLQSHKWNLDSAALYINCCMNFYQELLVIPVNSKGFCSLLEWLRTYLASKEFVQLKEETLQLAQAFDEMKFHIQFNRDKVVIKQGYIEQDYCKDLLDTFQEQSEQEHFYQKNPFGTTLLSALEEKVLDALEKPYAETFQRLKEYNGKYKDFIDTTIQEFEVEVQFYIAFLLYKKKMEDCKFHFCYPKIEEGIEFSITGAYDLALAKKNAEKDIEVIFNDAAFQSEEQFFVITGPNQGGKTTFARALGQILYFGSIGLMAPCSTGEFPPYDGIYTHFAVEENLHTGAGKLKEELVRLQDMMQRVTDHSFIIINEIFTSATSYDAHIMGRKVLDYFMKADCHGVYVTHIYELTKEDNRIVSLVATLRDKDSNIRTFKIVRKPADGIGYANAIVQKYQLNYQQIKERMQR